jgi:simple sugar transport system ATP-binding protein
MRKVDSGKMMIEGREVTNESPDDARRAGVAHVCEEHRTGFVFEFSLKDNLILSPFLAEKFTKNRMLDDKKVVEKTKELLVQFNVAARSPDDFLGTLSGGNRQKFLLARELWWGPKVVVANNPTKGLDVAAAEYVRNSLMKIKSEGKGVLLISTDLDEVLDMSDRIAVMNRGRVAKIMDAAQADIHELATLMTTSRQVAGEATTR